MPHIALKIKSRSLDRRTTRHPGYAISKVARKRIEEVFGWMKSVGGSQGDLPLCNDWGRCRDPQWLNKDGQRALVLIIDEDQGARDFQGHLFISEGFEVVSAVGMTGLG
jgi:hypothetical protein